MSEAIYYGLVGLAQATTSLLGGYYLSRRAEKIKSTIRNADMIWIRPNATTKLIDLAEEAHEKNIEKAPVLCGRYSDGTVSLEGVINDKFPLCLRHSKHHAPKTYLLVEDYRGLAGLKRNGPILSSHSHLLVGGLPSKAMPRTLIPSTVDREIFGLPDVLITYDPFTGCRFDTKVCRTYNNQFCFLHYLSDEDTLLNRPRGTKGWVETGDPAVKLGVHGYIGQRTIPTMAESDEVAIICGSRKEWQKITEQNPDVREVFDNKEILFSLETD